MSRQKDEETIVNKSLKFGIWAQEYSKRVVSFTFIIFLLCNVFYMLFTAISFISSGIMDIAYYDTFLSEMHLTFREVIGGYIIKAAAENVFKISGGIIDKLIEAKQISNNENQQENEEILDEATNEEECLG